VAVLVGRGTVWWDAGEARWGRCGRASRGVVGYSAAWFGSSGLVRFDAARRGLVRHGRQGKT